MYDSQGKRAPASLHIAVPDAATLTEVHAAWVTMGGFIQAISGAKVGQGEVRLKFAQDAAWSDTPDDAAYLANGGLFDFSLASSFYRDSVTIPALLDGVLDAGNKVDITDAAVKAFINALVSGFGAATAYTGENRFGVDYSGFLGCRTSGRGYSKQLAKKTWVDGSNYVP